MNIFNRSLENKNQDDSIYENSKYVVELTDGTYDRFIDSHLLAKMICSYYEYSSIEEMMKDNPSISVRDLFNVISQLQFDNNNYLI